MIYITDSKCIRRFLEIAFYEIKLSHGCGEYPEVISGVE
jgi:hypothetical protein